MKRKRLKSHGELPLGATEDRVCGTINLKEVLSGGSSTFEPGLLARAIEIFYMLMKLIFR